MVVSLIVEVIFSIIFHVQLSPINLAILTT